MPFGNALIVVKQHSHLFTAKVAAEAHCGAASSGLHGQEVCRALPVQECEPVLARHPQPPPVLVVYNDNAALQGF